MQKEHTNHVVFKFRIDHCLDFSVTYKILPIEIIKSLEHSLPSDLPSPNVTGNIIVGKSGKY